MKVCEDVLKWSRSHELLISSEIMEHYAIDQLSRTDSNDTESNQGFDFEIPEIVSLGYNQTENRYIYSSLSTFRARYDYSNFEHFLKRNFQEKEAISAWLKCIGEQDFYLDVQRKESDTYILDIGWGNDNTKPLTDVEIKTSPNSEIEGKIPNSLVGKNNRFFLTRKISHPRYNDKILITFKAKKPNGIEFNEVFFIPPKFEKLIQFATSFDANKPRSPIGPIEHRFQSEREGYLLIYFRTKGTDYNEYWSVHPSIKITEYVDDSEPTVFTWGEATRYGNRNERAVFIIKPNAVYRIEGIVNNEKGTGKLGVMFITNPLGIPNKEKINL